MSLKRTHFILAVATPLALTLAGCGGGGGGDVTPGRSESRLESVFENNPTTIKSAISRAASALPVPGSVTQSSNVDSNNITTDQVEVTATYGSGGSNFSIRNGIQWSIDMSNGNPTRSPSETAFGKVWQTAVLSKNIGSGTLYVRATTDIASADDTDYLSRGYWLIVPNSASSPYQFGAFADGSDPFVDSKLMSLTGTATYNGGASGLYYATEGGSTEIGVFEAAVRLTANFDNATGLGTISGQVTNFYVDDEPGSGTINMGQTAIGNTDSGFFRSSSSIAGTVNGRSYTGTWGGQFFGNNEADGRPGSVAGTVGARSEDGAVSAVGTFAGYKQ